MTRWILACACLLTIPLVADIPAAAPCPQSKMSLVVQSLPAAYGVSPMWLSASSPLTWTGSRDPFSVMWIRDRAAPGLAVVSGRDRASGARAQFGRPASILRSRTERYQLGWTGTRPPKVATVDLERFVFEPTDLWFPEPGCFEIVAQVGLAKSVFFLEVRKAR